MEACNAPQAAPAATARNERHEAERAFRRSRFEQMKNDLAQLKDLMAKFSQQLEEWPAQT
ncbi:MAG: hypothetical protein KIS92_22070 [Planctomycetota bacterium]|nr:hypothetical protein [Planctomycetota bacterium]